MRSRCRLLLCFFLTLAAPRAAVAREYAAIFNFGDSLADAGNLCVDGIPEYLATARLPYGMTHFGYPTGRVSDGRLVIDFIAQEPGLPLLPPSKARNASFHHGANFAITGATSLDTPFFQDRGLGQTVWNSGSLHTQIKWFQDMKPSICSSQQECRDLFRRSLFIVGEFGGNDYASPLMAFRPLAEVHGFVPHIVDSIARGVEKLIAEGRWSWWCPGCSPSAASRCTSPSFASSRRCTVPGAGASGTSTRCRGCTTPLCSARSSSSGPGTPACASCTPTTTRRQSSSSSTPRNTDSCGRRRVRAAGRRAWASTTST